MRPAASIRAKTRCPDAGSFPTSRRRDEPDPQDDDEEEDDYSPHASTPMLVRGNLSQPSGRLHGLRLHGPASLADLQDAHYPPDGLQLPAAYHKGFVIVATLWSQRARWP